jgi:hypothetical protein
MASCSRALSCAAFSTLVALGLVEAARAVDVPPPSALPAHAEEIYVVDEIPLVVPIAPGEPVRIVFGVGELEVAAIDGDELRAEVLLSCRNLDRATCLERGRRLRIEPRRTPAGLEVRMTGLNRRWLRKIGVRGSVQVPRSSPLGLEIGIGDIDIVSGDRDLEVSMGIGELTVEATEENVRSVAVRTKIGDASLSRSGEKTMGKRAMLVGARVRWQEGTGPSTIVLGLRIGDARVHLH